MDYSRDLEIDRYNLERELVSHSQLYMKWALAANKALEEAEMAKDKVELIKARIDSDVRSYPEKYNLPDNPKEGAIRSAIIKNKKVKQAVSKYYEALYNSRVLSDVKNSFRGRGKILEGLVHLNVQLHFCEPKVLTRKQEELWQDRAIEIRRDLQQSMRTRKIKRR